MTYLPNILATKWEEPKNFSKKHTKSPLNYMGGKHKLLPQILPLFPPNIRQLVDLFAGGCNVGINIPAEKVICNDNLIPLIDMYKVFQNKDLDTVIFYIENRIKQFDLSLTNEAGYKKLRLLYNTDRNPLDLFVLIAFSFNHQIRFNNAQEYNNPFGRERSSFNASMKSNLAHFIHRLKEIELEFTAKNFDEFDFSVLAENDFVYCDPPYLISTGTYNDGKRGFTGWNETQERKLLGILDNLNENKLKFALSNVLEHKGKSNDLLKNWLAKQPHLQVHYLEKDYANANYQTLVRDKNASVEVLITNYKPKQSSQKLSLF